MITCLKKKNNLAAMIRGKAIEEAIRFSYAFHRDQFSIPAAQNYANDLYYLRTKNLPSLVVKNNALPINTLVRTGIKAFTFLKVKKLKDTRSYKLKKLKYVYPDFNTNRIEVDGRNYKNCCIELKVSEKNIKKSSNKHVKQCINYSIKSRKPVMLIYLIFEKKRQKFNKYWSKAKFFLINQKNLAEIHL